MCFVFTYLLGTCNNGHQCVLCLQEIEKQKMLIVNLSVIKKKIIDTKFVQLLFIIANINITDESFVREI